MRLLEDSRKENDILHKKSDENNCKYGKKTKNPVLYETEVG